MNSNQPTTVVEQAQSLVRTLQTGGALVADQMVTDLAHKEGDEAVARVAQHLSPPTIATLVGESDVVKPSILHTTITADQFRLVFRRVGAKWSVANHDDCDMSTLGEFQQELLQFFCAFFLANEDGAKKVALLRALAIEVHGIDALVFSMIKEKDFADEESLETIGINPVGDFRDIVALVRSHPDLWLRFTDAVTRTRASEQDYREFVHDTAAEIYAVAVADGAVKQEEAQEADDLFTALP